MKYIICLTVFLLVYSCDYDSSVSVENKLNDTVIFFYNIQSINDSSLNFISEIDKDYVLDVDTNFRNEYVVLPKEKKEIIKHGHWKNIETKSDSVDVKFYFFNYGLYKSKPLNELINNRLYFESKKYSVETLLQKGNILIEKNPTPTPF